MSTISSEDWQEQMDDNWDEDDGYWHGKHKPRNIVVPLEPVKPQRKAKMPKAQKPTIKKVEDAQVK